MLGIVLVAIIALGGYVFPQVDLSQLGTGSPAGTTFSSAKVAQINVTPSSSSATTTSIQNTDASDRIIEGSFVSCTTAGSVFAQTAAGVAAWTWKMGTTSTANPAILSNTNLAADLTVATSSTQDSYLSSTTNPVLPISRRWQAGSYLTIETNATSSSAACTVGVHYLAS